MILGGNGGHRLGRVLHLAHPRGEGLGGQREGSEVGGDAGEEGKGLGAGVSAEELEVGGGGVAGELDAGLTLQGGVGCEEGREGEVAGEGEET